MVCPDNANWLFDYGLMEDIVVPDGNFSVSSSGFNWLSQPFNFRYMSSVEHDMFAESDSHKETGSKKWVIELGLIIEPGRPPKTDKAATLINAIQMVTQLRGEAQKLKDSNLTLQEKIKELKAEKNELRDEKQRLKIVKEKLGLQLKTMPTQPRFLPPPPAIPAAFAANGQAAGKILVPVVSYPGVAMWQFMPTAAVDTSQNHTLRPPVA